MQSAPENFWAVVHNIEGETHGTIPYGSISDGLRAIFSDWQPEHIGSLVVEGGMAAVDRYYETLSEKYGYTMATPEISVTATAYVLLGMEKEEQALAVFERLAEQYPESVNALRAVGDGYARLGRPEQARNYLERAVDKAERENHMNLPSTRDMLRDFLKHQEAAAR